MYIYILYYIYIVYIIYISYKCIYIGIYIYIYIYNFMIWQHREEKHKEFLKILNSCHPTIKFTAEYSLDRINFLDVEVIRSGNKLLTDLYIKPTDTHQYLEFSSCHVLSF